MSEGSVSDRGYEQAKTVPYRLESRGAAFHFARSRQTKVISSRCRNLPHATPGLWPIGFAHVIRLRKPAGIPNARRGDSGGFSHLAKCPRDICCRGLIRIRGITGDKKPAESAPGRPIQLNPVKPHPDATEGGQRKTSDLVLVTARAVVNREKFSIFTARKESPIRDGRSFSFG